MSAYVTNTSSQPALTMGASIRVSHWRRSSHVLTGMWLSDILESVVRSMCREGGANGMC